MGPDSPRSPEGAQPMPGRVDAKRINKGGTAKDKLLSSFDKSKDDGSSFCFGQSGRFYAGSGLFLIEKCPMNRLLFGNTLSNLYFRRNNTWV